MKYTWESSDIAAGVTCVVTSPNKQQRVLRILQSAEGADLWAYSNLENYVWGPMSLKEIAKTLTSTNARPMHNLPRVG